MTTVPLTIEVMVNLYLDGQVSPPARIEDRLRPASVESCSTLIDVHEFMGAAGVGRYASPFQTSRSGSTPTHLVQSA